MQAYIAAVAPLARDDRHRGISREELAGPKRQGCEAGRRDLPYGVSDTAGRD
jgi:hypothetical protein